MGRRLFTEPAADRLIRHNSTTAVASSSSDLFEEEVWAAASAISGHKARRGHFDWSSDRRHVGGLSRAFDGDADVAMSGPVAVILPEWERRGLGLVGLGEKVGGSAGKEEVEEEGNWIPPHEYLAREQGKTALANSVFEGVGRTLKGRDLSRVRDAVWNQTGFFG